MNDLTTQQQNPPKRREWKETLELVAPSFQDALPGHVTLDRFKRILATAIGTDPRLQDAVRQNPQSVWNAALASAKDGLIPDGREAALVVFNTTVKCADGVKRKLATAQYMPMVGGILKMMRQSGEVSSLSAHIVHENDHFEYELGDDEKIIHRPTLDNDQGKMVAAYAILKTKDGGIYRELMTRPQIMAVKNISRAKDDGPWSGPFEGEMWKKTVIRRLAKRAPLSTDVLDLIQRDDQMYVLPDAPGEGVPLPPPPERRKLNLASGQIDGDYSDAETVPEVDDPNSLDNDEIPHEHPPKKEEPPKPSEKPAGKKKPAAKAKKEPDPPAPEDPSDEPEQGELVPDGEPETADAEFEETEDAPEPERPTDVMTEAMEDIEAWVDLFCAYYAWIPREEEEGFLDDTQAIQRQIRTADPDQHKRLSTAINEK